MYLLISLSDNIERPGRRDAHDVLHQRRRVRVLQLRAVRPPARDGGAAGGGRARGRVLGVGPDVRRAGLRAAGRAPARAGRRRLARVPRHGRLHAARRLALQRLPCAHCATRRRYTPRVSITYHLLSSH